MTLLARANSNLPNLPITPYVGNLTEEVSRFLGLIKYCAMKTNGGVEV
jgi:hypothetical protein